jgi:hypothetical protein
MLIMTNTQRQIAAISITCVIAWAFAFFAMDVFPSYSFGLFIWLPIMIGTISTVIYAYKNKTTRSACRTVAYFTLLAFCLGLLVFAFEGIICIIMAAPIGLLFTWIGYRIGYAMVKSTVINAPLVSILLIVSVPCVMGFDYYGKDTKQDLRTVTTGIIINAPKEKVWQKVIAFSRINEPTDLLFKAGIAYPINAEINGNGVGAIRHCNFSTGSFVEPITKWEAPNLLQFDVSEQPATMKELSFYNLQPNHLHGYFISKHGQFKLIKLANNKTLLEGTTWYYNKIKPESYWNLWSDYIVHKIHQRVLNHIKADAEH